MKINIARVDASLPLPEYQTEGSVAFDLFTRVPRMIMPKCLDIVPVNVIIAVPQGHMLMIVSRSSTPLKKGLWVANGVGIVDQDYCGADDEIGVLLYNFTKHPVHIERGERIAQGVVVKIEKAEWTEDDQFLKKESRGGFGSTG